MLSPADAPATTSDAAMMALAVSSVSSAPMMVMMMVVVVVQHLMSRGQRSLPGRVELARWIETVPGLAFAVVSASVSVLVLSDRLAVRLTVKLARRRKKKKRFSLHARSGSVRCSWEQKIHLLGW